MKRAYTEYESPRYGDVFFADIPCGCGSAQCGKRPVVIVSNNRGNKHSPNVIALPLTSKLKKLNMPTHVIIRAADEGVARDSIVLCENPICLSKDLLEEYLTTLSPVCMQKVAVAHLYSTCSIACVPEELLTTVREFAAEMNLC